MKNFKPSAWITILAAAAVTTSQAGTTNLLGTDVSYGYGNITQSNWNAVAAAGLVFGYAHATTGYYYSEDPTYTNNMVRGKAAGLQMGADEFSLPGKDLAAQESGYFWNYAGGEIKKDGKTIDPMIFFEETSGYLGASNYTDWFNQWSVDVQAKTTNYMHPILYGLIGSGPCYLTTNITLSAWIASENGENPLTGSPWSCCTVCNAWDPNGTGNWTFWDTYTTKPIDGIAFEIDACPFSLANLKTNEGVGQIPISY